MESATHATLYVPGVFDLLHRGHHRLLRSAENWARSHYDTFRFVIGVHTDDFVTAYKRRPFQNEQSRLGAAVWLQSDLNERGSSMCVGYLGGCAAPDGHRSMTFKRCTGKRHDAMDRPHIPMHQQRVFLHDAYDIHTGGVPRRLALPSSAAILRCRQGSPPGSLGADVQVSIR